VRTVLGDVPASQLGVTYAHEHIIIDASFATAQNPDFLLDSVEFAVQELREFHHNGGRAVIDSMPCDCGRNVCNLAQVSQQSGVHIVVPTGLHLSKYYDTGHWSHCYSEEELAQLFIADIETGIDAGDYSGPLVKRTQHRAGVIKVASGREFDARTTKMFRAAAKAHCTTGAPILTHTEEGTLALEQIVLLRDAGADLEHVVLSHTDRKAEVDYHHAILESGVRVEYDSAFRWKGQEQNPTLELLRVLVEEFPNQIMLGMDAARRSYWKSYGGAPGLSFLLTDFRRQMQEADISDEFIERFFVHNPAQAYAFTTRGAS
jgi:phosphotriesterase-related protein